MRRLVSCTVTVLVLVAWIPPASAAPRSPRPTAVLAGTGTMTTEWGEEVYIDVEALDVDGIITEIQVLWGDRAVTFAHAYPCLLGAPEPGDPHRFIVSHEYEEPGRYRVRYVVRSVAGCDGDAGEQQSRVYTARVTAP